MKEKLRNYFSSRKKKVIEDNRFIRAAVLIPLFLKDNEYHILFTKRSHHVLHHKGEISFPGGKYSESDSSFLETALRESWEEIRLNPEDVDILGELDDARTSTSGFVISPFVAFVPYPYEFIKEPFEINEILYIPVSALLKIAGHSKQVATGDDKEEIEYCFEYQGKVIWGATARILKQLLDIIDNVGGAQ